MQVINVLNSVNPMSPGLTDQLKKYLKSKTLKTGEYLLHAGDVCRNVYFVEKGLLRSISVAGRKEVSNWFMGENEVVFAVKSFLKQEKSEESIQALDNCTLFYITYDELQYIYQNFSEFNWHGRVLTENYYILNMDRSTILAYPDLGQRYHLLSQTRPDYLRQIQEEYIASYLGVSLRTLQRHKNKKKPAKTKNMLKSILLTLLSLLYR